MWFIVYINAMFSAAPIDFQGGENSIRVQAFKMIPRRSMRG